MHSKKVIHRDIKSENVLLTKDDSEDDRINTKICDLGFAREAEEEAETFCGTTYYMAPEIFDKKKHNYKVDIWALGVLIFTMLYGTQPFKSTRMLDSRPEHVELDPEEVRERVQHEDSEDDKERVDFGGGVRNAEVAVPGHLRNRSGKQD